jgi:hypothetical protein
VVRKMSGYDRLLPDASLALVCRLFRRRKGVCVPSRLGWSIVVGRTGRGTSGYLQYRIQNMMRMQGKTRERSNN